MRALPPEFVTEINKRGPVRARAFFTFIAKNRATGANERLCLWTGDDHQEFTIEGLTDIYYGAGSVMNVSKLKQEIGTNIRRQTVTLSHLTPEVTALLREYEAKGADVKIHTILFSIESDLPVTPALRRFKGWVDRAPIHTPIKGGVSSAKIEMVSHGRKLTRVTPSKKSNENQRQRNATDAFHQYSGISGLIEIPWGSKRIVPKPTSGGIGAGIKYIKDSNGGNR